MEGILGDAEKLKFIPQEENLDKIQKRWLFLNDNRPLPVETKEQIVMAIYGNFNSREEVRKYVEDYIQKEFANSSTQKQIAHAPYEKQFDVFWMMLVAGELRDWKHWRRYGKQSMREKWGLDD